MRTFQHSLWLEKEIVDYILGNGIDNKNTSFTFKTEDSKESILEEPTITEIEQSENENEEEIVETIEETVEPQIAEHVTVPTPIEANIVEDEEEPTEQKKDDDDDDDDDDFNYTSYKGLI